MREDESVGADRCRRQDRQPGTRAGTKRGSRSWRRSAAVALGVLWWSGTVLAHAGTIALRTRSLAASCAACHGTDGAALTGMALPPLAGLRKDYFLRQMQAFRMGARPATVMQQIAKGFSDEQIEVLATYFSTGR